MLFGRSSNQGLQYKKIIEGFTSRFRNDSTEETEKRNHQFDVTTNDINRQISELARAQQVVNTETSHFLKVTRDNKYLNKNVRLNDGTIGYITKQGVFKPYNSKGDADETMGKNGCPTEVLPLDTGHSIMSKNGKYLNGDMPFYVGSPMVRGQQCGYAGQNIYVNSSVEGSGNTKYLGCKKGKDNENLIPTGLKVNTEVPRCPVGTFQCPVDGNLCYDPKRDCMSSTYMFPKYDAPPGKSISGKQDPYLADDGVTYLWRRINGWHSPCGSKPTFPPCPTGTAPCHTRPGYCYDPRHKAMFTTANPNGGSGDVTAKPLFMSLVIGNKFNYNEKHNPYTSTSPQSFPSNSFQAWKPDIQFTDPKKFPDNKIYYQFKNAAASLMPHLNIGESSTLKVDSRGNVIEWRMQGTNTTALSAYAYINGGWIFNKDIRLSNLRDDNNNLLPNLFIKFSYDTLYQQTPRPNGNIQYRYYFKTPVEPVFSGSKNGGISYSVEGAEFIVKKTSDNTADAILKYGPNTMNVSYKFDSNLPKYRAHILAQDGSTKLWKVKDGYDNACGSEPQVPPLIQGDEVMKQCKNIANVGGFGVYGIMDGECFVGNSIDKLSDGTNCGSFGSGLMRGNNGDFAAYELEGVKNSGLYRYGFVTADETLREYPNELQRATNEFYSIGKKQIARTPRVKSFNGMGGGSTKCQSKCISEFGNDCEAYNYESSSGTCTVYGGNSISEGVILPIGDSELMLRKKELNNNSSCPKDFINVKSSVWSELPKIGMMNSTQTCNMAEITKTGQLQQQQENNTLNQLMNNMNKFVVADVNSNKQLQPKYSNDMNILQSNLQQYNNLYNNPQ